MCVSPQRRAFFRHQNSKKCFGADVFCTFSLQNVLFATAACNFWFLLWAATSAPAALTGLLLDWPGTRIIEKTQHFATSLTFGADVSSFFWLSRYCIFFLPTWLPVSSAFQLSILSEVCYLNFLQFSPQRHAIFRHQNFQKHSRNEVFCTFSLPNVCFATAAYNFSTSELPKVLSEWGVLYIFTSKCVFRRSGVQFFDIWTSKSALGMRCFVHFHFQMPVSPQRRTIFRHLNFQKCSRNEVFCTFSLPNVLLATAACIFSTSDLRKVLRTRRFFNIFTSKCAFRHSGVEFLISPLSSYLRTRRFNRPTFGLTRHTNQWKNTAFRDFSNIWRGCTFFLLTFALLHLLSADLTTLLCFSTVHIVGSFYLNFLRSIKYVLFHIFKGMCFFWFFPRVPIHVLPDVPALLFGGKEALELEQRLYHGHSVWDCNWINGENLKLLKTFSPKTSNV